MVLKPTTWCTNASSLVVVALLLVVTMVTVACDQQSEALEDWSEAVVWKRQFCCLQFHIEQLHKLAQGGEELTDDHHTRKCLKTLSLCGKKVNDAREALRTCSAKAYGPEERRSAISNLTNVVIECLVEVVRFIRMGNDEVIHDEFLNHHEKHQFNHHCSVCDDLTVRLIRTIAHEASRRNFDCPVLNPADLYHHMTDDRSHRYRLMLEFVKQTRKVFNDASKCDSASACDKFIE